MAHASYNQLQGYRRAIDNGIPVYAYTKFCRYSVTAIGPQSIITESSKGRISIPMSLFQRIEIDKEKAARVAALGF